MYQIPTRLTFPILLSGIKSVFFFANFSSWGETPQGPFHDIEEYALLLSLQFYCESIQMSGYMCPDVCGVSKGHKDYASDGWFPLPFGLQSPLIFWPIGKLLYHVVYILSFTPLCNTTWSKEPGKQNEWLWLQGVESLTTVTPNFWGGTFIPPPPRLLFFFSIPFFFTFNDDWNWYTLLVLLFNFPPPLPASQWNSVADPEGIRCDKSLAFDKVQWGKKNYHGDLGKWCKLSCYVEDYSFLWFAL